jgi:molybdate transport system substrate-binding protein
MKQLLIPLIVCVISAVHGENMFVHARVPDRVPPAVAPVLDKELANEAAFGATLENWLARRGQAREIRIFTARALATVLAEIGGDFERATGHKLIVISDLPNGFLRRVNSGEHVDLFISAAAPVDDWIRDGKLVAATRTEIARSGIGVQVRAGSPRPDISTVDKFKRALLDAKSIAYLKVGSGLYLDGLLERLGISDAIKPKVTRPDTDIVSELVAKGEVELGMTVITQILTTPGVELVGPLPAEIQSHITFVAAVGAESKAKDAASELIAFLKGPRAAAVMQTQGMEPR